MSIRLRLLLSFSGLLLVTLLLVGAAGYLLTVAITGDARSIRDFYNIHYSLNPLTREEENLYVELKMLAKTEPDKLLDPELVADYDFRLRMVRAGLYVSRNGADSFASESLHRSEFAAHLPTYEPDNTVIRGAFHAGSRFYTYAKFDYQYSDGEIGRVFVMRERSPFAEMTRKLLPWIIGLLLAALVLTNAVLYGWITRSIVKPLRLLRESAEHIKEGQLQFRLSNDRDDEIGRLSQAFEEMRQRLKQSVDLQLQYEENRKELVSSISHDLRTPITTIKGYVEGLRDGVADTEEKRRKYMDTIYSRASDLDRLVDELFLFSKLDLNREPFAMERISLCKLLRDVLDEWRLQLDEKHVRLTVRDVGGSCPLMVQADRDKLKRVIDNIIQNALLYAHKDELNIDVSMTADRGQAVVRIADDGRGIPEDKLPRIFDRFYRADEARNTRKGGSGLGLAIARRIIEGHGGSISAESKLDEGTAITFRLPLAASRGDAQRKEGDA